MQFQYQFRNIFRLFDIQMVKMEYELQQLIAPYREAPRPYRRF